MPIINIPKGTAWATFELETKYITPPVIKLKLKPSFNRDKFRRIMNVVQERISKAKGDEEIALSKSISEKETDKMLDSSVDHVISLVVGWDLTDAKKAPIPCTDKNKQEYLPDLMWETVKSNEEETDESLPRRTFWLWSRVLEFATNVENFSKN